MSVGGVDGGPDPLIGALLGGKYRIEEVLDEGGFAVVYRAERVDLGRPVAVKVLRDVYAASDDVSARFAREARALAALNHPHIVSLVDYGVSDGRAYLVMELLPGRSLKQELVAGPIEPTRAFAITRQLLRGVLFAHGAGVLHRDLKPANVFLQVLPDTPDHVKILDFGFAKLTTPEGSAEDGRRLTRVGHGLGTPSYVAPEQIREGVSVDERADLYAVGLVLFEMLSGKKPFAGDAAEQLRARLTSEAPLLSTAAPALGVDPALDALVARALAQDPASRPASAQAFLDELEALPVPGSRSLAPRPATAPLVVGAARRPSVPIWLVAALALGSVVVLLAAIGGATLVVSLASDDESPAVAPSPVATAPGTGTASASTPSDSVLDGASARIDRGEALDQDTIRALRELAAAHPRDGRPHLLLGHTFASRSWARDAVRSYEHALRIDERSASDARMRAHLVDLATHPRVGRDAERLLVTLDASAVAADLDAALSRPGLSAEKQARLRQIRARLER